jgi:hypothetical protein
VRLVRLAREPSRVADDIRAALASLGRGSTVVGGLALIGATPVGCDDPVDAIAVLPRGVLIIIGVDLPDPAMRLEAPLKDQWKADGWPLVRTDDAMNPAAEALALSESIMERLRANPRLRMPVGTVVAVGPYVDQVDQPAADLAGTVRVLHPTPTSMLAATVSLTSTEHTGSLRQVRALLEFLAPDAPELTDEQLRAEGFTDGPDPEPAAEEHPLAAIATTIPADHPRPGTAPSRPEPAEPPEAPPPAPPAPAPPAPASPQPAPPQTAPPQTAATGAATAQATAPRIESPQPETAPPPATEPPGSEPVEPTVAVATVKPGPVRWVPLGAVALLVLLAVFAIVMATSGGDSGKAAPPASAGPSTTASPSLGAGGKPPPSPQPTESISFTPLASSGDQRCASHAYGDVQASLQRTSCTQVQRTSFGTTVDGRQVAVTVAVVTFADPATATEFKKAADVPGGGGIVDVATETGKWTGPPPTFAGAAYTSSADGNAVRLVQACWLTGPSTADDAGLVRAAAAALTTPLPG